MIRFVVKDNMRRVLWQGSVERLRLAIDQVLQPGEKVDKGSWDDIQTFGTFDLRKNNKVRSVTVARQ